MRRALLSLGLMCLQFAMVAQALNVLTYNIRYDNAADNKDAWPFRSAHVAAYLNKQGSDIIGIQEALIQQVEFLDSSLSNYERFGVGRDDGVNRGEFSPIYWKKNQFRFVAGKTYWLSETPDVPSKGWDAACTRIATVVELESVVLGTHVCVINTHWDHEGMVARSNSALLMNQWVSNALAKGNNVIVMGDFNCTPSDPALQPIQQSLTDLCPKKFRTRSTFNAFKMRGVKGKHIDAIYTSICSREHYKIDQPKTPSGRQLSDHFPVSVSVTFKPNY